MGAGSCTAASASHGRDERTCDRARGDPAARDAAGRARPLGPRPCWHLMPLAGLAIAPLLTIGYTLIVDVAPAGAATEAFTVAYDGARGRGRAGQRRRGRARRERGLADLRPSSARGLRSTRSVAVAFYLASTPRPVGRLPIGRCSRSTPRVGSGGRSAARSGGRSGAHRAVGRARWTGASAAARARSVRCSGGRSGERWLAAMRVSL